MAAVEEIRQHLVRPETMISLVNAVSLRDLPILLQACRLFVGNDSGPKHMAAALGVPTLGIHSSNIDAAEWAPLGPSAAAVRRRMSCGPCYISVPSDCHRQLACIRGIRASDVYRAARLLLATAMPTTVSAKADPDARVDAPTFVVPVQLDSKRPRRLDAVETDRSTRRRSRRA
jgi:ADP-heptose:LPS heptosyltransferase